MTWLLNPKVWAALLLAAALAFTHFFVYRSGKATVRNEFDAFKLAQAEARVLADRLREHLRAARQAVADKEAHDAQVRIAALETDVARAGVAGEQLRQATAAAVDRARRVACAASPSPGQPDSDPIGVLGVVLSRLDERAGVLAEYADRLRIAGSACESTYDKVTAIPKGP